MLALHAEGSEIKDSFGVIVYLRGCGKIHWDDDPTGWWLPTSGTYYQGYLNWNEANIRANLKAMRSWGMNVVRFHIVADWWLQDTFTFKTWTGSYRNNLKRTIEIAAEEGLYVMMDLFSPVNGSWMYANDKYPPPIPFGPYAYAEAAAILPDKQAFADYWASVANELKGYPNVIFELYNEPHVPSGFDVATARNDWFDAMQKAITAIRATGAENIIVVTWGLACVPHMGWQSSAAVNLGYVEQYPLNDPEGNLVYTAHLYRTYFNPIWYNAYDYQDCYGKMEQCLFKYVTDVLQKPVIIGEIGVNIWENDQTVLPSGLTALGQELKWAENVFKISNQWGIGYLAWEWSLPSQWQLPGNLPTSEGTAIATTWGQVLTDAIKMGEEGDTTPFLGQLEEGDYEISVPSIVTDMSDTYNFVQWNDGVTNPNRTISLDRDVSLVAIYVLAEPEQASLRGIVKDLAGNPLIDVDVKCNGLATKTGVAGAYEFTDLELRQYTVTVSKAGYQTQILQVDASTGGTITLPEVKLSPVSPISAAAPIIILVGTFLLTRGG